MNFLLKKKRHESGKLVFKIFLEKFFIKNQKSQEEPQNLKNKIFENLKIIYKIPLNVGDFIFRIFLEFFGFFLKSSLKKL